MIQNLRVRRLVALFCFFWVLLGGVRDARILASDTVPCLNVVFLDDQAEGLPKGQKVRYNNWDSWEQRLPTFLDLLQLVADFHRGSGNETDARATLYAFEISYEVSAAERETLITKELERICTITNRPSAILARSTRGQDQLRFVVQDSLDYTPTNAAKFLRVLSEISPPTAPEYLASSFGPFNPPPTIVFDPLLISSAEKTEHTPLAVRRWALLENTYLLPHYVLHSLASVFHAVSRTKVTYYDVRIPESGTMTIVAAPEGDLPRVVALAKNSFFSDTRVVSTIDASTFLREGKTAPIITCPIPQGLVDDPLKNNDLAALVSSLEKGGYKFKTVVFGDMATRASICALEKYASKDNKAAYFWDSFTGYYGSGSKSSVLADDLKKVINWGSDTKFFVTKTFLDQDGIELLKMTQKPVYIASVDLTHGIGISVPIIGGFSVPGRPSLVQDPGRLRSWDLVAGGRSYSLGNLTPDKIIGAARDERLPQLMQQGGVIFDKGNSYFLELSGSVRVLGDKAVEAVRKSNDSAGVFEDEEGTHLAVGIPMEAIKEGDARKQEVVGRWFTCDFRASPVGSIPLALPRIWAKTECLPHFGGGWTFEMITAEGLPSTTEGNYSAHSQKVVIRPFETGDTLIYNVKNDNQQVHSEGEVIRHLFTAQSQIFQPDLVSNPDGTFYFKLRHGVVVIFDANGLMQAIVGPKGERVSYSRLRGQIVEERGSDNRSFVVELVGQYPVRVIETGIPRVEYANNTDGRLSKVQVGSDTIEIQYDTGGDIAVIRRKDFTVEICRDQKNGAWELICGQVKTSFKLTGRQNTMQISGSGNEPVVWRFGPTRRAAGVILQNDAILWTRTSEGRIMQMAIGGVTPKEEGYKFIPTTLVGPSF
jgi:hypothetical protein